MDTAIRNTLAATLLLMACQTATASTWTFASGGDSYSTSGSSYGNLITFSHGIETLQVSAWANTAVAPANGFETAYIRDFSTGLGVCNREEGNISSCINGGGANHQVDNVGQQDPNGTWDRDVSFWVGNVSAGMTLAGSTFTNLGALGFGSQVDSLNTASNAALTISLGGYMGNALLVGGLFPADGSPDRFKIRSLVTTTGISVVPVPAGAWLLVSALGVLATIRRQPA
jgi:hypothetical protein